MINSVYGKAMDSLRKRINVRFVNNKKDFLKYTSRPTYVTHKLFNKEYAAIHEIKPVLVLSKPIYKEFTVLHLSKWLMYDFHYNFIKKNFNAKSQNICKDFYKWKDLFGFSNYSKDKRFMMILIKKLLVK